MGLTQECGGAAGTKCFPAGLNVAAKPCDYCNSTAALIFCCTDFAFMCMACDSKLHINAKHERVWICEVCQHAPAAVTCKADAAALCLKCDRDIHSANPLARRHQRAAAVPFYDTAESLIMHSTTDPIMDSLISTDSFITNKVPTDAPGIKSMEFLFSDSDQFLENYQICSEPCGDSVVTIEPPVVDQLTLQHSSENGFDIDFIRSNFISYDNSYTTPSLSHNVSSSSMDVGVAPDGTAKSEISYPFSKTTMSSSVEQVVGMDRKARVMRYKEKRKNRKFEKTIRYASRKAYAESRPRIKGRFAKRDDSQSDIDEIFSLVAGDVIGVVPSF